MLPELFDNQHKRHVFANIEEKQRHCSNCSKLQNRKKNQPCSLFDCYYNIRCTPAGVTHVSRTWNSISSFNQPPPGEFQNLTTYSTLLVNETSPFYEITYYWSLFIFPYNEKIFPSEHSNNNSLQVVEIFSTFYSSFFWNPVLPSSNSNWLTIELGL